jgi:hypothetical protein
MPRLPLPAAVAAIFLSAVAVGGLQPAPPPRPVQTVGELVKQLGSEDFAAREEATTRLSTLDVGEVPPELLAALKSDSPEVRERASKAVKALRERIALMRLPRRERFAQRGQIDLYVANSAAWEEKADDMRIWNPLHLLSKDFWKKAGPLEMSGLVKYRNLVVFQEHCKCRFIKTDMLYHRIHERDGGGEVIRYYPGGIIAPEIDEPWAIVYNLVISRGSVRARSAINNSILFANGDVRTGMYIGSTVVVCDGDVETTEGVGNSLVIARGNIKVKQSVTASTLIAGGTITIEHTASESTLIAGGKVSVKDVKQHPLLVSRIREQEANPFEFVKFFELSTVGVEVKVAYRLVAVSAVAAGKPFAAAGARVGDLITAVNGKRPESAESLRRLLRDALAVGDATVTLKRGDKRETVKVALPE